MSSKTWAELLIGISALVCIRTLLWWVGDTEGPNLLVVIMLTLGLYLLSRFLHHRLFARYHSRLVQFFVMVGLQIALTIGLYFCLTQGV